MVEWGFDISRPPTLMRVVIDHAASNVVLSNPEGVQRRFDGGRPIEDLLCVLSVDPPSGVVYFLRLLVQALGG